MISWSLELRFLFFYYPEVLTASQELCVRELGNVLVVAGAGTGKTSTLVERCVHLLLQENCSLEEILMVTFTDAAAAEMRDRIRRRLIELVQAGSESSIEHLQRQLSLLDAAHICTLHSFCLRLIRQHFHQLGIPPAVLVLDERQTAPLISQTFDALFGRYYEDENDEARAVKELISSVGGGSEEKLRRLTLKIYKYAQSLADPERWLANQLTLYTAAEPVAWREWLIQGFAQWRRHWVPELRSEEGTAAIRIFIETLQGVREITIGGVVGALKGIQQADEDKRNWNGVKTKVRGKFKGFFADIEFLHAALVADPDARDPLQQDWDWVRSRVCALLRLVMAFSTVSINS